MENIKLNVYNNKGEVVKSCEAKMIDLEFGTIRSLMELLNVENIEDTVELLKVVYGAWDQLIYILNDCFPEMEYEDWNHVKIKELLPTMVEILKYSFSEMLAIPGTEKN